MFAIFQIILSPFILKMTAKNAPAFLGGVGLLSTFASLLTATLIGDGLAISSMQTWVLATLIVWLVTALATLLLPFVCVRRAVQKASAGTRTAPPQHGRTDTNESVVGPVRV